MNYEDTYCALCSNPFGGDSGLLDTHRLLGLVAGVGRGWSISARVTGVSADAGNDDGIDELLQELLPDDAVPEEAGVPPRPDVGPIGGPSPYEFDPDPGPEPYLDPEPNLGAEPDLGFEPNLGPEPNLGYLGFEPDLGPEPNLDPAATGPVDMGGWNVQLADDPVVPLVESAGVPASVGRGRGPLSSGLVRGLLGLLVLSAAAIGAIWIGNRLVGDDTGTAAVDSAVVSSEEPDGARLDSAPVESEQDLAPPTISENPEEGTAGDEGELTYEAGDVADDASMDFAVDGADAQGRPLPALPDQLVANTSDPTSLPGYYPDPPSAPDLGPYAVIQGGRFYLRGTLSSENLRQEMIRRALLLVPADRLVIEYEIDEADPWYLDDPFLVLLEDDVLFAPGSDEVDERILPVIQTGASLLAIDPRLGVRITGHTDDQGAEDLNLELSQLRADAVRDQYLAFGVSEYQIESVGLGESEPVADNTTEEGREANRRVEIEVITLEG